MDVKALNLRFIHLMLDAIHDKQKLTLAEYEEMRKQKLLTKVVKKAEVDMGQFKGLSKFVKDDVETGFEALELEKTKKMKQKAKKEVRACLLYQQGLQCLCTSVHALTKRL